MEQDTIVGLNWVLRHKSEERRDQRITRAGEKNFMPTGIFSPYGNAMVMMSESVIEPGGQ